MKIARVKRSKVGRRQAKAKEYRDGG